MNQPNSGSSYWKGRWERKETGWHQTEPEPEMVSFFKHLEPTRVFVPLCGKSLDLVWLMQQGHEVIGVELSEIACQSFFEENKIEYSKSEQSQGVVYQGQRITLFNQDFFTLDPHQVGPIGTIYDRAALIALPPDLRKLYSKQMIQMVQKCTNPSLHFCQIVLERTPSDTKGPPFSVSESELKELYGTEFEVQLLSRSLENIEQEKRTDQCVYRLVRRKNRTGRTGEIEPGTEPGTESFFSQISNLYSCAICIRITHFFLHKLLLFPGLIRLIFMG